MKKVYITPKTAAHEMRPCQPYNTSPNYEKTLNVKQEKSGDFKEEWFN